MMTTVHATPPEERAASVHTGGYHMSKIDQVTYITRRRRLQ